MTCLKEDTKNIRVMLMSPSKEAIKCKILKQMNDQNSFEVSFMPNVVERYTLEIYFDNELVNSSK